MLKLFLWLRYLRKKRIVFLSIAAVALSTALLIVVASLFSGFIKAFEQSAVETVGDIVLEPPNKFAKYPLLVESLERLNSIEAASARLKAAGLLHLGSGNVRAVQIWGVEPAKRAKVTGFKQFLHRQKDLPGPPSFQVAGFPEKLGGYVGIAIATQPDEETDEYDYSQVEKMIGQQVVLTTGAVSTAQIKRKTIKFTITDVVFTGVYDLDESFVYLPIDKLQQKLYPDEDQPMADQIQIKLADGAQADAAMAQIRGLWRNFAREQLGWGWYLIDDTALATAKQMQSRYVAELRKQMGILLFIFSVVSLSVVLLVFCIFYMIVITRRKDIAIMKSCGAANNSVASVFVGFGAFVGIVGSSVGMILGYIVTRNINTIEEWVRVIFGFKLWKSSVYMFSRIPNQVDWNLAWPVVLSAVIAAAVGALIPAIVAARTKPVEILRYE